MRFCYWYRTCSSYSSVDVFECVNLSKIVFCHGCVNMISNHEWTAGCDQIDCLVGLAVVFCLINSGAFFFSDRQNQAWQLNRELGPLCFCFQHFFWDCFVACCFRVSGSSVWHHWHGVLIEFQFLGNFHSLPCDFWGNTAASLCQGNISFIGYAWMPVDVE